MLNRDRIAALRVGPGASPTYVCCGCKVELRDCEGDVNIIGQQKYLLRCLLCNALVGEWPTIEEKSAQLSEWCRDYLAA